MHSLVGWHSIRPRAKVRAKSGDGDRIAFIQQQKPVTTKFE